MRVDRSLIEEPWTDDRPLRPVGIVCIECFWDHDEALRAAGLHASERVVDE